MKLVRITAMVVALLLAGGRQSAWAFVPEQIRPASPASACPQRARWAASAVAPVIWRLNPTFGANIHGDLTAVSNALSASFATWANAPFTSLAAQRGPEATVRDQTADGENVLSFAPSQALGAGILAITFTVSSDVAGEEFPVGSGRRSQFVGQILDADILFNSAENFAVPALLDSSACRDASGNNICYDLQSLATHEIGHLFGLSHTGIWGAMLWPFAPPQGSFTRELGADDRAGIASLYPSPLFALSTGRIAGRVLNAFAQRTFGAHVVAVNADTGATAVSTLAVGQCVNNQMVYDGSYLLEGLTPGSYLVFAEPLDGPSTQGDYRAFFIGFSAAPAVDTSFTTRPH